MMKPELVEFKEDFVGREVEKARLQKIASAEGAKIVID